MKWKFTALVTILILCLSLFATGRQTVAVAKQSNTVSRLVKISPPPVANAASIRAHYHGQSITFLGDNAIGGSHTRDLALAREFTRNTGVIVKVVPHPVDDSYGQLVNAFRTRSSVFDVVMLDVVYPGALAPALVNLRPYFSKSAIGGQSTPLIANDTIDGRLVAMPW